ncbi:MAG: hypothetical protein KF901_34160, partial [Myxococcales bacterium]|nr:hypothetical protein [Myxococcales bacterium]
MAPAGERHVGCAVTRSPRETAIARALGSGILRSMTRTPALVAAALALFVLAIASCSDDPSSGGSAPADGDAGTDSATANTSDAAGEVRFVITAPEVSPGSNRCEAFTLAMVDSAGSPVGFPSASNVTVTSDALTSAFATLADCESGKPPTMIAVDAGATSKAFFVRTTSEEVVTLAAAASFGTASLTFAPTEFLTIGQPNVGTVRQFARTMRAIRGVFAGAGKLMVTDRYAHRVRVWNAF